MRFNSLHELFWRCPHFPNRNKICDVSPDVTKFHMLLILYVMHMAFDIIEFFKSETVSQTFWDTDPICESFFSLTAMLFRINFSTQPMEEDNTKRKIIIDTEKCFVLQNWQRELEWMRLLFTAQFINSRSYLYNPDSTAVVIKLFGSWATFVFQKPFAGHKN